MGNIKNTELNTVQQTIVDWPEFILQRYKQLFNFLLDQAEKAIQTRDDFKDIVYAFGMLHDRHITIEERVQLQSKMAKLIDNIRRFGVYPVTRIYEDSTIGSWVIEILADGHKLELLINTKIQNYTVKMGDHNQEIRVKYIYSYQWRVTNIANASLEDGLTVENWPAGVLLSWSDKQDPHGTQMVGLPLPLDPLSIFSFAASIPEFS